MDGLYLLEKPELFTKTKWNRIIIWYHLLSIPPTIEAIYKVAWSVSSDPTFKAHFRIPGTFPRSWQAANNSKDRHLRVEMGIEDDGKCQKKEGSRTLPKTETWPPAVQREIGRGKVMYGNLQKSLRETSDGAETVPRESSVVPASHHAAATSSAVIAVGLLIKHLLATEQKQNACTFTVT